MDALVAAHPYHLSYSHHPHSHPPPPPPQQQQQQHLSLSPAPSDSPSSSRSTPLSIPDIYSSHNSLSHNRHPLSISTSHSAASHHHDPEEETAHPLRQQLHSSALHPSFPDSLHSHHSSPDDQHHNQHIESIGDALTGLSRPLTHQERELLAHLDRLKFFLATAPSRWSANPSTDPNALPLGHPNSHHPALNRFLLPSSEYVSCILWGDLYHITGTDIVRALVFRFEAFGRPVRNMKKFEEGVFSDLRNLKPGVDACLEEPKSPFLDLLFKYQCIRTQKKQKVFYWFSVPHDRLFLDALERDLKREKMGYEPTTVVAGEPAASFTYDPKRSLYEQFSKAHGAAEGEGELEAAVRRADEAMGDSSEGDSDFKGDKHSSDLDASSSEIDDLSAGEDAGPKPSSRLPKKKPSALTGPNSPFFSMFSLFEGSPTYKQRRKKVPKTRRSPSSMIGPSSHLRESPDDFTNPAAVAGGVGLYGATTTTTMGGGGASSMRLMEPQIDRYGRDTTRMSAAEMFFAQARGDFGPQSNPDLVATQKERQRRAMQASAQYHSTTPPSSAPAAGPAAFVSASASSASVVPSSSSSSYLNGADIASSSSSSSRAALQYSMMMQDGGAGSSMAGVTSNGGYHHQQHRSHVEQRHQTYPFVGFANGTPQRSNTQPFVDHPSSSNLHGWPSSSSSSTSASSSATALGGAGSGSGKTKVFVCPLFSCGSMFRRTEFLKRHMKKHIMEGKPYQCSFCAKRFFRAENLQRHMRRNNCHDVVDGSSRMSGVDDDDVEENGEEEYAYGYSNLNLPDCEMEIAGSVHEVVDGDEEGLIVSAATAAAAVAAHHQHQHQQHHQHHQHLSSKSGRDSSQDVYFSDADPSSVAIAAAAVQSWSAAAATSSSTAALRASPAFSTTSMPSPQPRMTSSSSYGDYMSSGVPVPLPVSAPSHKSVFDHTSIYAGSPDLASSLPNSSSSATTTSNMGSSGTGPIRRHRSATPSVGRVGTTSSATTNELNGIGGGGRSYTAVMDHHHHSSHSARSYHPYAAPPPPPSASSSSSHGTGSHIHSASQSAESSPMQYTVPLDYDHHMQQQQQQQHHAHQQHHYQTQSHHHPTTARSYSSSHTHSRSHSRSSSAGQQLQDQIHQMLNIDRAHSSRHSSPQQPSTLIDSPASVSIPLGSVSSSSTVAAAAASSATVAVGNETSGYGGTTALYHRTESPLGYSTTTTTTNNNNNAAVVAANVVANAATTNTTAVAAATATEVSSFYGSMVGMNHGMNGMNMAAAMGVGGGGGGMSVVGSMGGMTGMTGMGSMTAHAHAHSVTM